MVFTVAGIVVGARALGLIDLEQRGEEIKLRRGRGSGRLQGPCATEIRPSGFRSCAECGREDSNLQEPKLNGT